MFGGESRDAGSIYDDVGGYDRTCEEICTLDRNVYVISFKEIAEFGGDNCDRASINRRETSTVQGCRETRCTKVSETWRIDIKNARLELLLRDVDGECPVEISAELGAAEGFANSSLSDRSSNGFIESKAIKFIKI